jgi:hypothetical protein
MNYIKLLQYFCKLKNVLLFSKHKKISLKITPAEILVRGILHPFHYNPLKKKLHAIIFIPPPYQNTISLNRLRYTNLTFCKQHTKSLKIAQSIYSGLATIYVRDILIINKLEDIVPFIFIASPMDDNNNYIDTQKKKVFINSLGLPMHCDLVYDKITGTSIPNEPNTKLRKTASEILKNTKYYHDPNPEHDLWVD